MAMAAPAGRVEIHTVQSGGGLWLHAQEWAGPIFLIRTQDAGG
jgi:hypothetical protein